MSGTSLDGLDICTTQFSLENGLWSFEILAAETILYSDDWQRELRSAHLLNREELQKLDQRYSTYIGVHVKGHLEKFNLKGVHLVGSHGHTVHHRPQKGITVQIGNQSSIREACELPVVCDFRKQDVELGGQGAPLVPIGDKLLFHEYDICLNLGGFANLSLDTNDTRLAWDIVPVNIGFNHFAEKLGLDYDKNGHIAASNPMDGPLFYQLNQLPYFQQPPPKSLGREWFESDILPRLDKLNPEQALATLSGLASYQIAKTIEENGGARVLCTGGGAHNKHLIRLIQQSVSGELIIPDDQWVSYKEALIFGFLGLLRMLGENNVLSSVTGASSDHSSGIVYA